MPEEAEVAAVSDGVSTCSFCGATVRVVEGEPEICRECGRCEHGYRDRPCPTCEPFTAHNGPSSDPPIPRPKGSYSNVAHYSTKKVPDPTRPTTQGDLLATFPAAINGFNAGGKSGSATIGFRVEQQFLSDDVLAFARLTGLEIEVRVFEKKPMGDILEMARRDEAGEPDDTPLGGLADFVRQVAT